MSCSKTIHIVTDINLHIVVNGHNILFIINIYYLTPVYTKKNFELADVYLEELKRIQCLRYIFLVATTE